MLELSKLPPMSAVLPSAETATEVPCPAFPVAPVPTSFSPCWVQAPALRVKTHVAPEVPSFCEPTIAVLPSADSATPVPWKPALAAPVSTSFGPC
jgi:hypothetical protein